MKNLLWNQEENFYYGEGVLGYVGTVSGGALFSYAGVD